MIELIDTAVYSRRDMAALLRVTVQHFDRIRAADPKFPPSFRPYDGCRSACWLGYVLRNWFEGRQEEAIDQSQGSQPDLRAAVRDQRRAMASLRRALTVHGHSACVCAACVEARTDLARMEAMR